MPDTTIISGKTLPKVTRRADGNVLMSKGHRGLVIPAELADNSLDPEARREIMRIIDDPARGSRDEAMAAILMKELTDAGKTLGQAADNQGQLRAMMEAATYSVVRTLP